MNPNNLAHKIIELENEIVTLKQSLYLSEQEIKEINLSNQMEISSYASQIELEEITSNSDKVTNSEKGIKTNKIDGKIIEQELKKLFKL